MTTHHHCSGYGQSRTYSTWRNMVRRCTEPGHPGFDRYGGRGVGVCERWLSFPNFLADMGEKPEGVTLERLRNDEGYEPGNCVWASRKAQTRNRRCTITVELDGVTKPLAQWCEERGLNYSTVRKRVARSGWTYQEALTCVNLCPGRSPRWTTSSRARGNTSANM